MKGRCLTESERLNWGFSDAIDDGTKAAPRRASALRPVVFLLLVALSFWLVGCAAVDPDYIEADDLTRKVVTREWLAYVEADKKLSEPQKEDRRRLARSWKARIDAARQLNGGTK